MGEVDLDITQMVYHTEDVEEGGEEVVDEGEAEVGDYPYFTVLFVAEGTHGNRSPEICAMSE